MVTRAAMLITSAGRRVELVAAFRRSAADLGIELDVHACDLDPDMSAACHHADSAHAVPRADDPGYADAVVALATRLGADLVVPTIDPELAPLATAHPRFAAAGILLAAGSPAMIAIARDKQVTAEFLAQHGIAGPRSARLEDALADRAGWTGPLFLKPCHGSSGRGIRAIDGLACVDPATFDEPMLVQERLEPPEFTVNCFVDRDGKLRAVVPHERLRVRAGEVEKGITRDVPELDRMARALVAALPGPFGAFCFQAMRGTDGTFRLFEINARFGGGYPLAHAAGAPFSHWLLEQALGLTPGPILPWRAGVTMLRHDSSVFLAP